MGVDILVFLRTLKENTTDAFGNPGQDPVRDQRQQQDMLDTQQKNEEKLRRDRERQLKIDHARASHEEKMRKVLTRAGFRENPAEEDLKDGEFSFYDRDTTKGKSDLEVMYYGKPVKIELKGIHPESGHQKQVAYTLKYHNPIEIPIRNDQNQQIDRMRLSPEDFHSFQKVIEAGIPEEPDENESVQDAVWRKISSIWSRPSRLYGLTYRQLANLFTQRGERFGSDIFKRNFESFLAHIGFKEKQDETVGKDYLTSIIPSVLASTGSHFSVIGNQNGIHILHHKDASNPDRARLNMFLRHINMAATHEPHEVHFSRSPGADPRGDETRGGIGFMGLSLTPTKHPFFTGNQNKKARNELLEKIKAAMELNTKTYREA